MTFSIIARDSTGALGQAVSSSSPAVAARCLNLRSAVGAVSSQNITDPRFGPFLLRQLTKGKTAKEAFDELSSVDSTLEYRQITILPVAGPGFAHSGSCTLGTHAQKVGDNCVVAGNMLKDVGVVKNMVEAFERSHGALEERLMQTMKAGLDLGGEAGPVHSAGLAVTRSSGWNETDLRVDWSDSPLDELEELLAMWLPQRDDYVIRGQNPASAPSYGVPGNE